MKTKINGSSEALRQGEMLLRQLSDSAFNRPVDVVFGSTIGMHFRHNLDHYRCFLQGLDSGCIDYAARRRDARLEQDRSYALSEISKIRRTIKILLPPAGDIDLFIARDDGKGVAATSIIRELEFLLSHTVHHYAIVAILCRLQGIEVNDGFGVAPSTLRHLSSQDQQANTLKRVDSIK